MVMEAKFISFSFLIFFLLCNIFSFLPYWGQDAWPCCRVGLSRVFLTYPVHSQGGVQQLQGTPYSYSGSWSSIDLEPEFNNHTPWLVLKPVPTLDLSLLTLLDSQTRASVCLSQDLCLTLVRFLSQVLLPNLAYPYVTCFVPANVGSFISSFSKY